jgi:hypothetical protein
MPHEKVRTAGETAPRAIRRRGFLQWLAGAVTMFPVVAFAQTASTTSAPAAPAVPAAPEHTGSEARLVTEVLRTRYPDRFSEAQWGSIVGDVDGDLGGAKRLRAVKLANGDEPDFTFRP